VSVTTVTSRELNQHVTQAKKAAEHGPVFITDRGRPAHVLLSMAEYQRLTGARRNIADAIGAPDTINIDFDAPRSSLSAQVPDFDG